MFILAIVLMASLQREDAKNPLFCYMPLDTLNSNLSVPPRNALIAAWLFSLSSFIVIIVPYSLVNFGCFSPFLGYFKLICIRNSPQFQAHLELEEAPPMNKGNIMG